MQPDDDICYCYHVSLRKLYHFARRERLRHPSQMSECLGAGTGCGWCIPLLCKIAENAPLDPTGEPSVSSAFNSADYAAARRQYLVEKRPRNSFDGSSALPPPETPEPPEPQPPAPPTPPVPPKPPVPLE